MALQDSANCAMVRMTTVVLGGVRADYRMYAAPRHASSGGEAAAGIYSGGGSNITVWGDARLSVAGL